MIAAIASLLTGPIRRRAAADRESLGAELAAVAGEGTWEPSELMLPAADETDAAQAAVASRAQLTLPLEREVHGFVRAPGGAAVPGIPVTAASVTGEIVASATTDADGCYRLTGLGDGEHVLVAGGHEPVRTSVDVHGGETTSVTVRIGNGPAVPAAGGGAEAAGNGAGQADHAGPADHAEAAADAGESGRPV